MGIYPASFFGLTINPGQEYASTMEEDTHITMASLNHTIPKNGKRSSVVLTVGDAVFTLCSLTPEKVENQSLDIYLHEGDEVSFKVVGTCPIDITGYNVVILPADMNEEDMSMDGSDDEEIDSDLAEGVNGVEQDEEEDEEEDDDEEMEFDAALISELNKRKAEPVGTNPKRAKVTEKIEELSEDEEEEEEKPVVKETKKQKKERRKAEEKTKAEELKKTEDKKETKVAVPAPEKTEKASAKTLPSGLVIQDDIVGKGPVAKSGMKVSMRYIGKLTNGKVFDSNTKGAPFTFKLGKGEVIKGWDVGIQGMHVGGTRKLTIPPQMAYGSRGAPPDIPKNATLTFDVKLLQVK